MIQHLIPAKQPHNGVYLYGRLVDKYIKELRIEDDILHVELGYGEHVLFWQTRKSIKQNPSIKLVLTIHDAPMVVGKPFAQWLPGSFIITKLVRKLLDVTVGKKCIEQLVKRANAIIVLNQASVDLLAARYGIPQDLIHVSSLPSLTPLPAIGSAKPSGLKLLYFGNISPRKGLDVLIQALQQLPDLPLQLDVVGSSKGNAGYMNIVKRAIQDLGEDTKVIQHGFLEEAKLGRLLVDCDIVILPYREENVLHASGPLAAAMKAGKAIICSDVRSFGEIVPNNSGLVFKQDDSAELAAAIKKLADDPALRGQLGKAAAKVSQDTTSPDTIKHMLQEVYASL